MPVATYGTMGGLNKFDRKRKTFTRYHHDSTNLLSLVTVHDLMGALLTPHLKTCTGCCCPDAIVDYLMTKVLSHQSPEMARLMAATAIQNHFCAPLFEALEDAVDKVVSK